jgi:hypothetical protein
LLIGFEFANSSQTSYSSFESYIPLELKIFFLKPKILKIIYRNLNSIIFSTIAHVLAVMLGFAAQDYTAILVAGIIRAKHTRNIIGINNIRKDNILFVFC